MVFTAEIEIANLMAFRELGNANYIYNSGTICRVEVYHWSPVYIILSREIEPNLKIYDRNSWQATCFFNNSQKKVNNSYELIQRR